MQKLIFPGDQTFEDRGFKRGDPVQKVKREKQEDLEMFYFWAGDDQNVTLSQNQTDSVGTFSVSLEDFDKQYRVVRPPNRTQDE